MLFKRHKQLCTEVISLLKKSELFPGVPLTDKDYKRVITAIEENKEDVFQTIKSRKTILDNVAIGPGYHVINDVKEMEKKTPTPKVERKVSKSANKLERVESTGASKLENNSPKLESKVENNNSPKPESKSESNKLERAESVGVSKLESKKLERVASNGVSKLESNKLERVESTMFDMEQLLQSLNDDNDVIISNRSTKSAELEHSVSLLIALEDTDDIFEDLKSQVIKIRKETELSNSQETVPVIVVETNEKELREQKEKEEKEEKEKLALEKNKHNQK